jgi:hypothetical protein
MVLRTRIVYCNIHINLLEFSLLESDQTGTRNNMPDNDKKYVNTTEPASLSANFARTQVR